MRAVAQLAWIRCSPLSESWQTEARPGEAIGCDPSVWLVADRRSSPSEKTEARLGEAIGTDLGGEPCRFAVVLVETRAVANAVITDAAVKQSARPPDPQHESLYISLWTEVCLYIKVWGRVADTACYNVHGNRTTR